MTMTVSKPASLRALALLALFLIVVLGAGLLIGMGFPPGEWYAGLTKPPFNPPGWIFAPVWTTLYVMIAVAGWRTVIRDGSSPAMRLWLAQLFLNWAWTPIFFGAHALWLALVVILILATTIGGFIMASWSRDRLAAILMVPYLAWVSFASLLNFSLAWLNG